MVALTVPFALACGAGATLTGAVTEWGGTAPVAGIEVVATPAGAANPAAKPITAVADAKGVFKLSGLVLETSYDVACHRDGWICERIRVDVNENVGEKPLSLRGHAWPSVDVYVRHCLTGAALDDVAVQLGANTGATIGGKVTFSGVDPSFGRLEASASRAGMQSGTAGVSIPTVPPFQTEAVAVLCPSPPEGSAVLGIDAAGQDAVVAPSSRVDGPIQHPLAGDLLQIGKPWYPLSAEAPVLTLAEVGRAPRTGQGNSVLVREASKPRHRSQGWVVGRVVLSEGGTVRPELPWKVWAFYQTRPELIRSREGGYIGATEWAYYELTPPNQLQAWTTFEKLADHVVLKGAVGAWDLVKLPGEGPWALINTGGAMPWPIYVVNKGG